MLDDFIKGIQYYAFVHTIAFNGMRIAGYPSSTVHTRSPTLQLALASCGRSVRVRLWPTLGLPQHSFYQPTGLH
jgi:hypothetical protein